MQWRTRYNVVARAAPVIAEVLIAGALGGHLRAQSSHRTPENTEDSMQTIAGRAPEGPAGGLQ